MNSFELKVRCSSRVILFNHWVTLFTRLLSSALEVLDGAFTIMPQAEEDAAREMTLTLATSLLTLTTPELVQLHTKSLLASLFNTKTAYHNHKVSDLVAFDRN